MSYPWLHESEMSAARAEHEAGAILSEVDRDYQRRLEARLESDPDFRAWADARYLERRGTERPHADAVEPEAET
jgi:hypothetical protein